MTFLAPWALVLGALGAAGAVLLHLVARHRPAAYVLPTTRFIPDRRTLVSRVASRPRDLWLLLIRVLLILSTALAFAQPVMAPQHASRARIVLVNRSRAVGDPTEVASALRAAVGDGVHTRFVVFDSTAATMPDGASIDDVMRTGTASTSEGSLSAALVAARRVAGLMAAAADSVELVLISPVTRGEIDAATLAIRAQWPGAIAVHRLEARRDSAAVITLERAIPLSDVLGPALAGVRVASGPSAVRLKRGPLEVADSALATRGGAVVAWDTIGTARIAPNALAMGDDVIVASVARHSLPERGRVLARWSDGAPAAIEVPVGAGCLRHVGVGIPTTGDLPLRKSFQRVVRGLMAVCSSTSVTAPAAQTLLTQLSGNGGAARSASLIGTTPSPSPLVPWLLAFALLCVFAELAVRGRLMRVRRVRRSQRHAHERKAA